MEGLLKTDIPSKLSGSRQNLPWINTELKRQIRRKGRRFSKAKKSGLKEDWDNFIAIEKDVKRNLNPCSVAHGFTRIDETHPGAKKKNFFFFFFKMCNGKDSDMLVVIVGQYCSA